MVQVCGTPFGIKMFANGAMVVGFSDIYTSTGYQNPAKTAGLRMGDVITSIAGRDTKTNEDVAAALQGLAGAPAEVVYVRDGVEKSVLLTAVKDSTTDSWRTGMWVRDSSAGIGTLTFVDNTTGTFHDVDTGTTISLLKGEIVPVEITGAVAGSAGSPGELKGRFLTSVPTGTITVNGETGVYGSVKSYMKGIEAEVALAQEVNTGDAEIITTIEGQEPKRYTAVIEKIALSSDNPNRNMVVRVTDPPAHRHRRHRAGHERQPHPAGRPVGGRGDACAGKRPHPGLRHFCGKYGAVCRCGGPARGGVKKREKARDVRCCAFLGRKQRLLPNHCILCRNRFFLPNMEFFSWKLLHYMGIYGRI